MASGFKAINSFKPGAAPSLNLPGVSGLSTVPTPTTSGGGSGGGKKGGGASEAQKQLEQQQQQLQAAKDLLFASENQLTVLEGITEAEKLRAESGVKKLEIERKYAQLLEESKSAEETLTLQLAEKNELKANEIQLEQSLQELRDGALSSIDEEIAKLQAKLAGKEKEYELQKKINDLVAAGGGTISEAEASAKVNQLEQLKAQNAEFEKMEGMVKQVSGTIASEFTSAITSVIDGSKSIEEAFSDMLQNIGKAFIDMAMQIIQEQIKMIIYGTIMKALGITMPGASSTPAVPGLGVAKNFGGTFADGGRPKVGDVSIVGERGPELFVPDQPGRVMSHEASRAAMAQYSPSNEQMAATAPMNTTINYNGPMLNFNGDEYIPRSEAGSLVAAGAKQGEQRAMNRLRQSRSTRSKIGI